MALRLIEFLLPKNNVGRIDDILDETSLIGHWQQTINDELTLVRVLTESDHVETIIQSFEEKYAHLEGFRAILMEVKATSPAVEIEADRAQEVDPDEQKPSAERIACMELMEKLTGDIEVSRNYILTVILSAIVATIGLVRNNVAIIIGAMVIAPLLTPNMALSLATILGDSKLAQRALKANLLGMLIALLLAASVGFFLQFDPRTPEILSRAEVGYSDIILALAAGSAGALAFTSGISTALVGVMVAVAILPPLVAAGLLLGSGYLPMGIKALLLTLANIICVNLSGVGMFFMQRIRPRFFWEEKRARRMMKIAFSIWVGLLGLLVGLIYFNQRFMAG